jgi:sugar phosphate isomerase/epimerase
MGIAAASGVGSAALGAAGEAAGQAEPPKEKGMRIGMLTSPMADEPLEKVADFAKQAGIACLEVAVATGSPQLDPTTLDAARADAIKKILSDRGVEISSLANYDNMTEPGKTETIQAFVKKMIDAAVLLGVPVICLQTGAAVPNMNKINTIKKVVPKVFGPLIAYAAEKQIKIAVENYFETCLQGIDTFECLFETIQDANFGLNYDPSHLYHQQCNHLLPVTMFANRIFHTHAKDTLVNIEERARLGVYARGWWRYVIPGFGNINWGEYIGHLRMNGYDSVLSIEHEDSTFNREQGFIHGARYLTQFC